ncbi:MAG: HAD-IB family phosphatase [Candidatus Woesearchaeota archaeon]
MTYKLICFDMSGVLFRDVNFWMELHKRFGTFEQGKILTDKLLHTDYTQLVQRVVAELWKGRNALPYFELVDSMQYIPGVEETLKYARQKGYATAIISCSSMGAARRVQKDHGIDFIFANELVIRDNVVSGEFLWPVGAGGPAKADIMQSLSRILGVNIEDTVFVGDNKSDIDALRIAGRGIVFNPQADELKEVEGACIVESQTLADVVGYI